MYILIYTKGKKYCYKKCVRNYYNQIFKFSFSILHNEYGPAGLGEALFNIKNYYFNNFNITHKLKKSINGYDNIY